MMLIPALLLLAIGSRSVQAKIVLSGLPQPVELVVVKHVPFTGADPAKDPILISHGLFSRKEDWSDIPQQLADQTKRTVYMLDNRDHGESPWTNEFSFKAMVADTVSFLNKNRISKVVLVGYYFAGVTFSKLATLYPELVSSLMLVDLVPHKALPEPNRVTVLLDALNAATETLRKENITDLKQADKRVEEVLSIQIKEAHVRRYLLVKLLKKDGKIDWQFNLDQITKSWQKDQCGFLDPLPSYKGPVLEIAGGQSMFIKPEDYPSILERFPNIKFVTIPDDDHAVPFTHKKHFISEVVSFLENDFRSVESPRESN